mmetsp:Transcript_18707/g.46467  ORF Transcript_18707/g.46467 Transcript_18707/m.46467 type:complete len:218 (+) Transcript_18707:611-1264(+)
MISGGTNRTTFAPAGTNKSPSSMAAPTSSPAVISSAIHSTPRSKPHPRTFPRIVGYLAAMASSPSLSCSPRSWTLVRTSLSQMYLATAKPAAQARGFPPYVLAWSPGPKVLAASPLAIMAPIGTPPPKALAEVKTSGTTSSCSCPHRVPVRPIPAWTSSIMRRAPASSHSSRAFAKKALSPGMIPPSPWRGSSRIAANPFPFEVALFTASSRLAMSL